jgi:hypothetical protein
MSVRGRLAHAWNAFTGQDTSAQPSDYGAAYSIRPDRVRMFIANERSILSSIYTRMAIDIAAIPIRHVRLDDSGRYEDDMSSGLQTCLTLEANLDQAPRAFRQDLVMTLFDRGVAAIVPIDTTVTPSNPGSFDILTMRVGEILQWYPAHVRVSVYNEQTGRREEIMVEKRFAAVVENPLFAVMNEPNSTLQRLIRKLNLLDAVDEASSSGKLDMIIQLPYVIKSDARRQQADSRRAEIESQLRGSKYGIAYTDGTEKITQLNRPIENNLMGQIEYLMNMLYSELGLTPAVMNGTAGEPEMLNYNNRAIDPVLTSIVEAMTRTFLTKTARTQGQSILYFRDPFKLLPLSSIAEIADKLTRNEVVSSNEIRQFLGLRPSKDPKADQLRNSNMPQSELGQTTDASGAPLPPADPTIRVPSTRANPLTPAINQ